MNPVVGATREGSLSRWNGIGVTLEIPMALSLKESQGYGTDF